MRQWFAALWLWLIHAWRVTATYPTGTDTEFTAEVVRITRILPHPNADRLEIARFELNGSGETTYEVVIQKGEFSPGDIAAYFSVDCILPLTHSDFAFLGQRMDGIGKTHFRLKAARLRGVFSQGLLTKAPVGSAVGDPLAESYGVTYHNPVGPEELGPTAATRRPKPQPMQVYGVDSLKKVPRLFDEGEEVVITEKIHGCNFRFGWCPRKIFGIKFGHTFRVGSHRAMKGAESRGPGFYKEDVWLEAADRMGLKNLTRAYKGYTFYGELYGYTYGGKPLQDLTYGRNPVDGPGLAVFDIKTRQRWLTPNERHTILIDELQLPVVPILYSGPYTEGVVKMLSTGWSTVRGKGSTLREGVVVESAGAFTLPRKKAKYVGEEYLMRKQAA